MRATRSRLRTVSADAADAANRQGPKTLASMGPIHAPRAVLDVFASAELEAIRLPDGEIRVVKGGARRSAARALRASARGEAAASSTRATVKMVPSGDQYVGVLEVEPAADAAPER